MPFGISHFYFKYKTMWIAAVNIYRNLWDKGMFSYREISVI